ncbi:TPA: hypothetical protein ACIJRN_001985 [Klebsiella aerogenes]
MDFEIIWDDDEMEALNALAKILLKENEAEWQAFQATLANPDLQLTNEDDDYFEVAEDTLEDTEGDLTSGVLSEIFVSILQYEGIIESIDWKGEMGEGQLARFAAERYEELTNNSNRSELEALLIKLTSEAEMEKVCDTSKVHIDIIFERIQDQLSKYGLVLAHLFDGNDCYNVFVINKNDFIKLQNIDSEYLTVQAC